MIKIDGSGSFVGTTDERFGGWNGFYKKSTVFHESIDRPKLERNPPEAKKK
jgi:hypothetical protein